MKTSAFLALALLAQCAHSFKFMANWKMPTLQGQMQKMAADEKFGDKKLVVITGTSSGLGRKTAAALLRTGKYHVVGAVRAMASARVAGNAPTRGSQSALQGVVGGAHLGAGPRSTGADPAPLPSPAGPRPRQDGGRRRHGRLCARLLHAHALRAQLLRLGAPHTSHRTLCPAARSFLPSSSQVPPSRPPQVRSFVKELETFKCGKPVDRLICNAAVYQPSLPYAKWTVDGHEQQMQINFLSHFLLTSLLIDDLAQ
jgi:NAD(P)-dependent dehydrogenase (short-subunit alcohol dehydrogenase family)